LTLNPKPFALKS